MKKIAKALAVCAGLFAAFPLSAATETVDGYTWTYRINGDTAEIGYYSTPAISPKPNGVVTIPSTLGGKPVASIYGYAFYNCTDMHCMSDEYLVDELIDERNLKGTGSYG